MVADYYTIASSQYGLVTTAQLISCGLNRQMIRTRVRNSALVPVHTNVYAVGGAPDHWLRSVLAACLTTETHQGRASHTTAARLWNLNGVTTDDEVHITVVGTLGRRLANVQVHETAVATRTRNRQGIPVTAIERTLMDLAACVPTDQLEYALDDAVRRRLTTVRRCLTYVEAFGASGRAGTAPFRRALHERDGEHGVPESVLERKFLRLVAQAGLPAPVLQYPVRAHGRVVARIDFAWPRQWVFVEVDGEMHHTGGERWRRDLQRQNRLDGLGIRPVRYTWRDLDLRPQAVVAEVAAKLSDSTGAPDQP